MRKCSASLWAIWALSVGIAQTFDIHTLLDSEPQTDPNAKPCQLTQTQLDQVLAPSGTSTEKYILISSKLSASFAQNSAELLSSAGFQVCQIDSAAQQLPGDVTVIQPGARQIVYYGKRNAQTLLLFVQKLDARYSNAGPMYSTITNKMEKKAFERLVVPKVVAFFPDPSTDPALAEFAQAARQLASNPLPFFVVHDIHFAYKLRLNQPGQIALIHRLEKSTVYFQSESQSAPVATAADIVAWINKNRGLILHEIDEYNLYDPEVLDPSKFLLAAVADQTSPLGLHFYKILTKAIQNISRENEIRANLTADQTQLPDPTAVQQPVQLINLDDIEIVWIDLQKYPLAAQKLSQSVNFASLKSNKDVHFGLVQIPAGVLTNAQPDQWFDFSQLLSFTEKRSEEANIQVLRDWILTVTDRLPQQVPASDGTADQSAVEPQIEVLQQEFSLEPEPVNARQGASFVLDCKVQYKAGQCQWLKDQELVDVDSLSPAYQWVNEQDIYDCSISVSGADVARDSGKWTCQVTETSMPDGTVVVAAIESKPVVVKVRPAKVAKPAKPAKGEL